ncbi:uncharacterized membrane protein YcaP (DUF421 family) [Cytobacillus firmus]|uniref:Uncharacterized membrane protein YcaP (DUF421 family) n=2 Tax=Cytobacillus TaxID=2675230 RepID=A0A366JQI1_CYTFI|nr:MULTISPECIES: DUF421 domain-containing protein [Cytobacillus]RBP90558.1 uncharacterized membrane protein YcaP (DUF421 family) [Cytobacillus firmus]TDX46140.1 uncharacterized membrane protein YcaP (DUF421 family) [Cytobacillus oceanisediminis]
MNFIWESVLLIFSGVLLLRVAGRKSISQMTLAQTVVMISIGTIIIQPIVETSVWKTIAAAAILVGSLILMEYLQVKFNFIEKFITGKSKIVIENGKLKTANMRKLRFTADQLEMRLRTSGITKISDVKMATLEPNGQLGYELMNDAKPLTVGEFKRLMGEMILQSPVQLAPQASEDIFQELKKGHTPPNPKDLH